MSNGLINREAWRLAAGGSRHLLTNVLGCDFLLHLVGDGLQDRAFDR